MYNLHSSHSCVAYVSSLQMSFMAEGYKQALPSRKGTPVSWGVSKTSGLEVVGSRLSSAILLEVRMRITMRARMEQLQWGWSQREIIKKLRKLLVSILLQVM